jgi:hypothetical protein
MNNSVEEKLYKELELLIGNVDENTLMVFKHAVGNALQNVQDDLPVVDVNDNIEKEYLENKCQELEKLRSPDSAPNLLNGSCEIDSELFRLMKRLQKIRIMAESRDPDKVEISLKDRKTFESYFKQQYLRFRLRQLPLIPLSKPHYHQK